MAALVYASILTACCYLASVALLRLRQPPEVSDPFFEFLIILEVLFLVIHVMGVVRARAIATRQRERYAGLTWDTDLESDHDRDPDEWYRAR